MKSNVFELGRDLELAIVGTLAPSVYTAIVRGVNNGTVSVLVEIYNLQ